MAYTRVWDNSAPPGTALANTLDTIIQEFRQDTQQRISSLLKAGTTIDDDPLQLAISSIGGGLTDRLLTEQPFIDKIAAGTSCLARIVAVPLVAAAIARPFGRVPGSCTVKQFVVQVNPTLNGAPNVILELRYFIAGAVSSVSTATFTVNGLQTFTSGALAQVIAPGGLLFVSCYKSPSGIFVPDVDIYRCSVAIDTPSLTESF